MYKTKVSIVIPIYNKQKYLEECLDSIIAQTYENIEIICVDDGSTDSSLEILYKYKNKDNRIIIIEQENRGAGNARNTGMAAATGKYIQFLDADDFFEITMVEKMINKAEKIEADIVICNALEYIEETKEKKHHTWLREENIYQDPFCFNEVEDIFLITQSNIWNKLYRMDFVLENNLKFQEIISNNDTGFSILTLFLAKKITYVNEYFIYYRNYVDSYRIATKRDKNIKCCELAYQYIIRKLRKEKKLTKKMKITLNEQIYKSAMYELTFCKDNLQAKEFLVSLCKLVQRPERYRLLYYLDGFINIRKLYLFGFIPVLTSVNLKEKKVYYMFNYFPIQRIKK